MQQSWSGAKRQENQVAGFQASTHYRWHRAIVGRRLQISWVVGGKLGEGHKIRNTQAWKALNGISKISKSGINRALKVRFFIATIESILLHGCDRWPLSEAQEKSLNSTYTRMLRKALNVNWSSDLPNMQLYGDLPAVSDKIASRRLHLADHCYRHSELSTHVLWEPKHGRSRPRTNFINMRDTGAGFTGGGEKHLAKTSGWSA